MPSDIDGLQSHSGSNSEARACTAAGAIDWRFGVCDVFPLHEVLVRLASVALLLLLGNGHEIGCRFVLASMMQAGGHLEVPIQSLWTGMLSVQPHHGLRSIWPCRPLSILIATSLLPKH